MQDHELKNLLTALGCPSLTEDETNQILQKIEKLLWGKKTSAAQKILKDTSLVGSALNETLWKIHLGISNYRGEGTGWGWVNKILKHECLRLREVRTQKKEAEHAVTFVEFDDWQENWCEDESNGGWGDGPDYYRRIRLRDC